MKNVMTKKAFANWCDQQPADERYDWGNVADCACAQYASAINDRGSGGDFWHEAQAIALGDGDHNQEWTFGALAQRLRSV